MDREEEPTKYYIARNDLTFSFGKFSRLQVSRYKRGIEKTHGGQAESGRGALRLATDRTGLLS